jgi:hypothetical protein
MRKNERRAFPEYLQLQAPLGFNDMLDRLAAKHFTSRSEYVRQTLLRAANADGVALNRPRDRERVPA